MAGLLKKYGSSASVANRSSYVNSLSLGIATAESATIPTGAKYIRFKATTLAYADFVTTAAVPADVTDGSAPMILPAGLATEVIPLSGVTAISLISPAASVVTMEYWS